jgi:hypothetical protein
MRVLLDKIPYPGKTLFQIAGEVKQAVSRLAATETDPSGHPYQQTVGVYDETLGDPIYLALGGSQPSHDASVQTVSYKTFTNRDITGRDFRTLRQVDSSKRSQSRREQIANLALVRLPPIVQIGSPVVLAGRRNRAHISFDPYVHKAIRVDFEP